MLTEVIRKGRFLYTPLHTNVWPSPARIAKNEGTRYLGGVTHELSSDTSSTKAQFSLQIMGLGNTQ